MANLASVLESRWKRGRKGVSPSRVCIDTSAQFLWQEGLSSVMVMRKHSEVELPSGAGRAGKAESRTPSLSSP